MDLQSLLKEWGFERIKHKYDLPKDYIPYDYKNDLKSKLISNWNDEKLKIVLEQLSNFNNEVYIDINSYFYYIIFLQANLRKMDINKLIDSLGYKRVFKKEKDTEQKLSDVESLLNENKSNYISNKIEKLCADISKHLNNLSDKRWEKEMKELENSHKEEMSRIKSEEERSVAYINAAASVARTWAANRPKVVYRVYRWWY